MGLSQNFKIQSVKDLRKITQNLLKEFQLPSLLLLEGEMGSGKTTFVKSLVEQLLPEPSDLPAPEVSSPTFGLHQTYETSRLSLDHLDLHRLETESELESMGFWDLFDKKGSRLIAIEWPPHWSPEDWPAGWQQVRVHLKKSSTETGREITIEIL